MKHRALFIVALALASSQAMAKEGRIGLGLNLGRADLRYDLDAKSAVDGFLGFDSLGGDAKGTGFQIGAAYIKRIRPAEPVGLNFTGGLAFESTDGGVSMGSLSVGAKTSSFDLFGGIGAEYFLPGTKQLSIEASVGLMIRFISQEVLTTATTAGPPPFFIPTTTVVKATAKSTEIGIADLTGGMIILRYYFE